MVFGLMGNQSWGGGYLAGGSVWVFDGGLLIVGPEDDGIIELAAVLDVQLLHGLRRDGHEGFGVLHGDGRLLIRLLLHSC